MHPAHEDAQVVCASPRKRDGSFMGARSSLAGQHNGPVEVADDLGGVLAQIIQRNVDRSRDVRAFELCRGADVDHDGLAMASEQPVEFCGLNVDW